MTARRVGAYALLVLVIIGAVLAVARAADAPSGDPVRQAAEELSCPDCAGQSVADSNSPVAESMRKVIAGQIAQGRTPDQVREWFVDRYGQDVLRMPPSAADTLLWAAPLVVAVAAGLAAAYTIRRRRIATADSKTATDSHRRALFLSVSGVVVAMVAAVGVAGWWIERPARTTQPPPAAASAEQPLALAHTLESQGDFAAAADIYRDAAAARPDPAIRLRLAFALLRAEKPGDALDVAESVHSERPNDPDSLLILGLAQRANALPQAEATLSRFLQLAPNHPAAREIRGLLDGHGAQ